MLQRVGFVKFPGSVVIIRERCEGLRKSLVFIAPALEQILRASERLSDDCVLHA